MAATFPVTNPQSIALLNAIPYLTTGEYRAAPTALDVGNLDTSSDTAAGQDAALAAIIARASSWIDNTVFPDGTGGTLACSVDTDTGTYPVNGDGYLRLVCRFKPVIQVLSMVVGATPGSTQSVPPAVIAGIEFGPSGKVLYVPAVAASGGAISGVGRGRAGMTFCQWSYVDGYPHTILADAVTSGDDSLTLAGTLGMQPGTTLTIYDQANTETVAVAAVTDATTVSLAAPCLYNHAVPEAPDAVSVSALPPVVKQAAILCTSMLIKNRGDSAFVLPENELGPSQRSTGSGSSGDAGLVVEMLRPFMIVTGRG